MTSAGKQGCCGGAPTAPRNENIATVQAEQKHGCGCKNEGREAQATDDASSEAGTRHTSSERRGGCC